MHWGANLCYVLPWNNHIEMHGRVATNALICKAVLRTSVHQVHWAIEYMHWHGRPFYTPPCNKCIGMIDRIPNECIDIQGRVTYCRSISELECMAELQTHALQFNIVLHTTVGEVHWDALPNCKETHRRAMSCFLHPCNKCIGIANTCIEV